MYPADTSYIFVIATIATATENSGFVVAILNRTRRYQSCYACNGALLLTAAAYNITFSLAVDNSTFARHHNADYTSCIRSLYNNNSLKGTATDLVYCGSHVTTYTTDVRFARICIDDTGIL